jgi:hypothetical protein
MSDGHTNELSSASCPVSVICTGVGWSVGRTASVVPHYPPIISSTFSEFLQALPPWEATLLKHITFHQDMYTLDHCLQTDQASIGVSDGSVLGEGGAFGWCLSQRDGPRLATGMGSAQGLKPSSYHAEGYGMLSILCFLIWLCELMHILVSKRDDNIQMGYSPKDCVFSPSILGVSFRPACKGSSR